MKKAMSGRIPTIGPRTPAATARPYETEPTPTAAWASDSSGVPWEASVTAQTYCHLVLPGDSRHAGLLDGRRDGGRGQFMINNGPK